MDTEQWFKAAEDGDGPTLARMASAGHPLDSANAHGWTALQFAAMKGHLDAVSTLLDLGANPNVANALGITPLMLVGSETRAGQVLMIYGPTECLCREEPNRLAIATKLLAKGADPNLKDAALHTALTFACANLQTSIVKLLIEQGADVHVADYEGETLEHFVVNGTPVASGWTEAHDDDYQEFVREETKIMDLLRKAKL